MASVDIDGPEELGRQITRLAKHLRYIEADKMQAYQFIRINDRPYKIIVQSATENEYRND